ncbi:phosphatidylglycerophosphatase A family protein [Pseudocolwellia sp. HL-MZ19]|uniref:phosphatidylglycerophosphatase A family protein n=1 Tax=Pseudocolwellia sp. HL-MZ19 TaxID=3400846 RepID=UPI003CEC352D
MTESKKEAVKFTLSNPIHFLALGFGSGLSPKAPGTFGTVVAIPVFLLFTFFTPLIYAIATLVVCIAGIYICGKTAEDVGVHDHGAIVWDEIAGYLITMFLVPVSWQSILVGFILFRIFDIFKPWPISYLDKYVHGGFGIMIDDVVAGLMALACMHLIF